MRRYILGLSLIAGSASASTYGTKHLDSAMKTIDSMTESEAQLLEKAPSVYQFKSRSDANSSSVSYTGQSFRQVLNSDLKAFMGSLKRGNYDGLSEDAYLAMDSYYSYRSDNDLDVPGAIYGFSNFMTKAKSIDGSILPASEGVFYDDLQENGKQLRNKTAGNDNPLRRGELKGWNSKTLQNLNLDLVDGDANDKVEPEDLVDFWMKACAHNASEENPFLAEVAEGKFQRVESACVTEDGLDITQLVQKFLHGSVSFSQAARDYLSVNLGASKGLNASNELKEGSLYTAQEHHWDEAFGYYGSARDYLNYQAIDIAKGLSIDTDGNGKINMMSEKNYGLSINAAKHELGAAGKDVSLVFESGDAFIKGRHLIAQGNDSLKPLIRAQAIRALAAWEKTIAASVIHYINKTMSEMSQWGTDEYLFKDHAKYWSEMKGFALAFQFSPVSLLSDKGFDLVHSLMRDKPVLGHASPEEITTYKEQLLEARGILAEAFEFSDETVSKW